MLHRALVCAWLLGASGCSFGVIPRDAPNQTWETNADRSPRDDDGPRFILDGARLVLPEPIHFQGENEALSRQSELSLNHVRDYLVAVPAVRLRVEGYAASNALATRRAVRAGQWLVAHGIACDRLVAVGIAYTTVPPADASHIEVFHAGKSGRHTNPELAPIDLCAAAASP